MNLDTLKLIYVVYKLNEDKKHLKIINNFYIHSLQKAVLMQLMLNQMRRWQRTERNTPTSQQ